jgi:hypothetical protein
MKYDKPVWQLMYECADAMPDPFGYEHVHRWFARRYPEVSQATIRAHLVGLCEGGRPKQPQFAVRSSLFRRVARGLYEVIPPEERKLDPDLPETPDAPPPPAAPVDRAGREASFATSAFTEATVVQARPEPDVEARHDRPGPSARLATFEDIVERAGLAGPRLEVRDPTAESADVLLLAGSGERVLVPAPAREVYRADRFQAARLRAQARGATWFVLSAEHGLLEPGEWVSPDSRDLADLDPVYRSVWAQWVLVRLESLDGPVAGRRVHLVAPAAYVGPLAAVLQDAGAEVTVGGDEPRPVPVVGEPRVAVEPAVPVLRAEADDEEAPLTAPDPRAEQAPPVQAGSAQDAPSDTVLAAVEHLAGVEHAVRPQDLDAIQEVAGVFAWHVDAEGARVLNRSLMLPVGAGVLHVGHAGAVGRTDDVVTTVRHLVQTVQLHGRSRSSTFRAALATILQEPLRAHGLDDPVVADWMQQHLRVVTWPMHDREAIRELAQHVVEQLEPPLNVDHLRAGEVRRRLGELRRATR